MKIGSRARAALLASATAMSACGGGSPEDPLLLSFSYLASTVGLWSPVDLLPNIGGLDGHDAHCRLSAGALPDGLQLDLATCAISGQADEVGSFRATIRLTVDGFSGHVDATVGITVMAPQPTWRYEIGANAAAWAHEFSDEPLINWFDPEAGDQITYELLGGLPPDLALDPASGEISGTPTDAGTFLPRIRTTIRRGGLVHVSAEDRQPLNVAEPVEALAYDPLTMVAGQPYSAWPQLTDPLLGVLYSDYTFSLQAQGDCPATLPPGWTLQPETGRVSGTATAGMDQCVGIRLQVRRSGLVRDYHAALRLSSP